MALESIGFPKANIFLKAKFALGLLWIFHLVCGWQSRSIKWEGVLKAKARGRGY